MQSRAGNIKIYKLSSNIQVIGVIIFGSVRFLSKKVTKLNFF
jgi:hypothetical protein